MASWTQTFSVNNKYSLTLECSESSYSVANNNSVVSYKLTMATAANSFTGYSDYRTTISISINGSSVYSYNASRDFNASAASSYSEVLKSGTVTVAHNSDGTKTCACAASVTVASGTYSPGSASISQNLTLTTIPRASSISASGQYIGSPVSISISRASSSFTHDLTYSFAGHTGTVATGVATSYSWTPSLSTFGPYIPSSTSGTCTITCTTKNGSTTVGTSTTSFTLYLADSVKPTVSSGWETASYVNSGGASSFAAYVQGYSKLRITFNASKITHGAGASLSKYRLTVGGKNYDSTSTTVTSDTLTSSGSVSYTVYVYDSRNRYTSYTGSITVYVYAAPTISSSSIFRSNASGTADSSGAYISVKASTSVSSVNGLNSGTLRTRYRPSGGSWSGWTTLTPGTASVIGGALSPTTTYIVAIELTDTMGNTATTQATIPTESVTFNLLEGGNGAAFGKYAETDHTLELASNWRLNPGGGIVFQATADILSDAFAQALGMRFYMGSGGNYTGDLPAANYQWGTFVVNKRYYNSISVVAYPENAAYGIAINSSADGSTWHGWQRVLVGTHIIKRTFSKVLNLSANGNTNLSFESVVTIPSGYSVLGIAGVSTNNVNIMPINCEYKTGDYAFSVRNLASSAQTGRLSVNVLFILS